MLLNGEIELDVARAYSGIARTIAQAVTSEITKARFLRQEPDLTLDVDAFEAGEEA